MDFDEMLFTGRLGADFPLPPGRPFTHAMALDAGLRRVHLTRLTQLGLLRRPLKGVYVASETPDSLALRVECLKLVVPPDCVVVDRHAGWLLGAQMILAPGEHLTLQPVSVFRPSGHGRLRNGLSRSGERWLREEDVVEIGGIQVTSPLRTAWDLGRVRWRERAIAAVDAMHRLAAYDREEFLAGIEQFRGHRWVRTLREIGPLADGRSESPGESVLRLMCQDLGLRLTPQVEVVVGGRLLARLDLGHEWLKAAAEYDGAEWHTSPQQQARDRRRRRAVRSADWLVEAFDCHDVFDRHGDAVRRIHRLRETALRRVRGRTLG